MAITKTLHAAVLFWAYGVLHQLPLIVFLFFLKGTGAIVYTLLQKPLSSGKKISRAMVSVGNLLLMKLPLFTDSTRSFFPVDAYYPILPSDGCSKCDMDTGTDTLWGPSNHPLVGAQRHCPSLCSGIHIHPLYYKSESYRLSSDAAPLIRT